MKTPNVAFLLLTLPGFGVGGCGLQPPGQAQAGFDRSFALKTIDRWTNGFRRDRRRDRRRN
jgi:hypothetical protein